MLFYVAMSCGCIKYSNKVNQRILKSYARSVFGMMGGLAANNSKEETAWES